MADGMGTRKRKEVAYDENSDASEDPNALQEHDTPADSSSVNQPSSSKTASSKASLPTSVDSVKPSKKKKNNSPPKPPRASKKAKLAAASSPLVPPGHLPPFVSRTSSSSANALSAVPLINPFSAPPWQSSDVFGFGPAMPFGGLEHHRPKPTPTVSHGSGIDSESASDGMKTNQHSGSGHDPSRGGGKNQKKGKGGDEDVDFAPDSDVPSSADDDTDEE